MNYSFTVNKKDPIDKHDYDCVWRLFEEKDIQIVYKIIHTADKEIPHLHYHGVIYTKFIDIKEISKSIKGYRFEITNKFHPERWYNYCHHEEKQNKSKLIEQINELKGQNLLNKVMEAGQPMVQQKLPTMFKITILGNI